MGLLGLGQVPAGAAPVAPAGRADDVPPPEDLVKYVPELIDFGQLREEMRARYKGTFAGLVNNGDDSLTIFTTKDEPAMRGWVDERFKAAVEREGVDTALIPEVTWKTTAAGGLSLDALFGLKDTIMAAAGLLKPLGVEIGSIGLQDGTNKVIVGVTTPVALATRVLEQRFGRGHIQVIPWKLTTEADRWTDSPPWNGGDQIVTEGANPGACTAGFGVHDANNHYVTTAGHCNAHFWWNTWIGFPIRTSDTLLGVTSGTVWNGVYFGYRVDTQKILTNGSSSTIIWTGTSTRKWITNALDVTQGDPSCIEGSFTLTHCGTVWATDFGEGGSEYVVDVNGASTTFGDSGAPSWRDSIYGALAEGTHVGSLSNGMKVEQNIFAVLFFNGVQLNTIFDP